MEFKGTKGEWKIGNYPTTIISNTDYHIHRGNNDKSSIKHYGGRLICESVLDPQDAKLIAAAPDLLNALINLKNMYVEMINSGDCGNWNPREDKEVIEAEKALEKALKL